MMTFKKLSERKAELVQPPTPTFHLESRTTFQLVGPHYLDMEFRCTPTQHVFAHGYIGLFWASYINAPDDKSMYFRNGKLWQQPVHPAHNVQSTVRHKDDSPDLKFSEGLGDALYRNLSPPSFKPPFFYGQFRDMVFVVMFESADGLRVHPFAQRRRREHDQTNDQPGLGLASIVPKYDVKKEYGFGARVMYRPKCSRVEIQNAFEQWVAESTSRSFGQNAPHSRQRFFATRPSAELTYDGIEGHTREPAFAASRAAILR